MDARRYDRNADILSQVIWHYTQLQKTLPTHRQEGTHLMINEMLELLTQAIHLNDNMGQFKEKGLI